MDAEDATGLPRQSENRLLGCFPPLPRHGRMPDPVHLECCLGNEGRELHFGFPRSHPSSAPERDEPVASPVNRQIAGPPPREAASKHSKIPGVVCHVTPGQFALARQGVLRNACLTAASVDACGTDKGIVSPDLRSRQVQNGTTMSAKEQA